jgi:hypothetical protein
MKHIYKKILTISLLCSGLCVVIHANPSEFLSKSCSIDSSHVLLNREHPEKRKKNIQRHYSQILENRRDTLSDYEMIKAKKILNFVVNRIKWARKKETHFLILRQLDKRFYPDDPLFSVDLEIIAPLFDYLSSNTKSLHNEALIIKLLKSPSHFDGWTKKEVKAVVKGVKNISSSFSRPEILLSFFSSPHSFYQLSRIHLDGFISMLRQYDPYLIRKDILTSYINYHDFYFPIDKNSFRDKLLSLQSLAPHLSDHDLVKYYLKNPDGFTFFKNDELVADIREIKKVNRYSSLNSETQEFQGKKIKLLSPHKENMIELGKMFGKSEEVFLGIGDQGHYYLIVGETKIEGLPFPFPSRRIDDARISRGLLVHFPDIPKETIRNLREKMSKKNRFLGFSISCTHRACAALKDGFGIRVKGTNGPNILTSSTLEKILNDGFVDTNGQEIPFEIIKTSQRMEDLTGMNKTFKKTDKTMRKEHIIINGVLLLGPLTGWGLVISFKANEERSKLRRFREDLPSKH